MALKKYGVKITSNNYKKDGFDINFPMVELPGSRIRESKINDIIKDKVRNFLMEEIDNEVITKVTVDYSVKLNKRGLLSILLEVCSSLKNEKKLFTALKSINLDIRKAEALSISDLFPESMYYDYIINKMLTEKIENNQTPLLQEFTNFNNINFYYLTEGSLIIYIPLYKDTKYALSYCTPEFEIPLGDIKWLLGPKSPASRLLKNG